jgi:glycosyltransferase involved in cell wall biosynthesis
VHLWTEKLVILHAIAGLAQAAGTSVFCGELCNHLSRAGEKVSIALPCPPAPDDYLVDRNIRVAQFCRSMPLPSIVHIHAIWSRYLHHVSAWAAEHDIPIVISPHGMLTPWALRNRGLRKWLALQVYQHADMARASLFHATSQAEAEDIRRLGYRQPIVVAPLGVDLPVENRLTLPPPRSPSDQRIVLFLSRVHPKKGLPLLLEAWARLKASSPALLMPINAPGWRLVIAGPDECGHTAELFRRCEALGLVIRRIAHDQACSGNFTADVAVTGPVYSTEKASLYMGADIFALPSHSENFGAVVAEALAYGLPVITTTGTPWHELQDVRRDDDVRGSRAGWWIRCSTDDLTTALHEAMSLSDQERHALGRNGRWLVEHRYSWDGVAEIMSQAYGWILGKRSPTSDYFTPTLPPGIMVYA